MKDLFEVFFEPGKVFTGLTGRRGAWVVPMLANTILLIASTVVTMHVMGMDLIMRQRFASSNMSPEQMQAAMERAASPVMSWIIYGSVAIFTPIGMVIVAGLLMVFGMMSSKPPKFGAMLAMVNLAFFPYFLVTVVMTALVTIAAPDKTALNIDNLLATNVGAFVNKSETSKGLYALFTSIDVLSIIEIGLLSFGFSKVTKTGFGAGLGAVTAIWILYVASKMAASLFQ
jgi:hypothetical protein